MNRRTFIAQSFGGLAVVPHGLARLGYADESAAIEAAAEIARAPLRPEDDARLRSAPTRSALQGERYRSTFPDTLDLAERMQLAINALTNVFIPQERWALAFEVDFSRSPVELKVNHSTDAWLNIPAKFIEALVNCRLASGSDFNLEVDRKILATQLGLIGDDGLTYAPEGPLPELKGERNYSEIWGEGRLLLALAMLAQVDDDPRWVEIGRRKVDRLLSLSHEKEGYRFFWKGRFRPGEAAPPDATEPTKGIEGGSLADGHAVFSMMYSVGALGYGAGLFYRVTRYPPALDLSRGLAKWALARMFKNADGRYNFYHFHHGTFALMAVAEYAEAAQDTEVLRRVDACYRWAREMGDPLVGWYPEFMPGTDEFEEQDFESVEICEVSDMVFLALLLTRNGAGDYWDDVDRWVRNMYAEGQMTDADFVKRIPDCYLNPAPGQFSSQRWISIWTAASKDARDIALRSVGSFYGWMRANDGLLVLKGDNGEEKLSPRGIMHCCTANGARTLYYVWDSIVSQSGEEVRVNLLLNRASEWLDVHSYLPAQGKVVLKIKKAATVAVRLPEWVASSDVNTTVGRQKVEPRVQGRYAAFEGLKAGDEVELTFPVPERTLHRVLGRRPYKLTLKGSNVVAIDPPGVACPLYQCQPTGKLMEKACFIPSRKVIW
jgi:DUF1680 family protein